MMGINKESKKSKLFKYCLAILVVILLFGMQLEKIESPTGNVVSSDELLLQHMSDGSLQVVDLLSKNNTINIPSSYSGSMIKSIAPLGDTDTLNTIALPKTIEFLNEGSFTKLTTLSAIQVSQGESNYFVEKLRPSVLPQREIDLVEQTSKLTSITHEITSDGRNKEYYITIDEGESVELSMTTTKQITYHYNGNEWKMINEVIAQETNAYQWYGIKDAQRIELSNENSVRIDVQKINEFDRIEIRDNENIYAIINVNAKKNVNTKDVVTGVSTNIYSSVVVALLSVFILHYLWKRYHSL